MFGRHLSSLHRRAGRPLWAALGVVGMALWLAGCASTQPTGGVRLAEGELSITVVPGLGGRVSALHLGDSPNLLLAASAEALPATPRPDDLPLATDHYLPLQGHEMWVAPQRDWWSQQTVNEDRRSRDAIWPPDPYLARDRCDVTARTERLLALRGHESPVTGLAMDYRMELLDGAHVRLTTVATNRRTTPVRWGLWSNTRIPSSGVLWAAADAAEAPPAFASQPTDPASPTALPSIDVTDGWLCLTLGGEQPPAGGRVTGKLQFQPRQPWLAVFLPGDLLLIKAACVPLGRAPADLAPGHSAAEVYVSHDGTSGGVVELELHGRYSELAPGAAVTWAEQWTVRRLAPGAVSGLTDRAGQHAVLAGLLASERRDFYPLPIEGDSQDDK